METPLQHILGSFFGVALWQFWPIAVMLPIVILVVWLRPKGSAKTLVHVPGRGFVSSRKSLMSDADKDEMERIKKMFEPSMGSKD